jgi:hypothetical protein
MKKVCIIIATFALVFSAPGIASAAAKAGSKCSKSGVTTGSGAAKMTCKKVNNKLVWVKTPAKPTLGSISLPVPNGGSLLIGGFEYKIMGIEFGLDKEICKTNPFNDGCTYDDQFNPIVDPKSNFNWAAVTISASNKSNTVSRPGSLVSRTFSLVLPSGQLLKSEIFALGDNDFSQVEVIPGGTGVGRVFFQIPKSITSLKALIVIRDESNFLKVQDFFFTLEW